MKRWQIIAAYCGAGPVIGGLVVATAVAMSERTDATPLLEVMLICVAFAFPFGGLAALGSGIVHALLAQRVKPAALVCAVVAAGLACHLATAHMLGNLDRVVDSPGSFVQFSIPVVVSASVLCALLLRFRRHP